ncbi:thioredoxin-like protein [Fimicolochytrium jonesii]|uniref:thioredoxin-like protein n=1 Tax=Fimicolochytrium jonesii TaxID=1396493 RepID=UPI0022FE924A|nr:thioredoxin-like protein [Fimicolochytrium jonesii]KAI8826836.1 thioredoxin-like protein [Fimicolochytrium jonesii]
MPPRPSTASTAKTRLGRLLAFALPFALLGLLALVQTSAAAAAAAAITTEEYKAVNKLVTHIPPSKFAETIATSTRLVFFGSNSCPHCREFTPAWLKVQQRVDNLEKEFYLHKVECTGRADNEDLCNDQQITGYPTVRLFHNGKQIDEPADVQDLENLNVYVDGQIAKYASDKVALENLKALAAAAPGGVEGQNINLDGRMVHLTDKTFEIMTNNTPWFVMFHAPWCGHCKQLKPVFEDLAPAMRGKVNIGALNCDDHPKLCKRHNVRGYPTVKFLELPGTNIEYKGARSYDALKNYLTNLSGRKALEIVTSAQIPKILQQNEVAFFLSLGGRYIQHSDALKAFKTVATNFRNDARFYVTIDSAANTLLKPPPGNPHLLALKDNGETTIPYIGDYHNTDSSRLYMRQFIAAHRYPRVTHLDANNQEEILGGDRLVVMAVIEPSSARRTSINNALKDASRAWAKKEEAEKLHDLVVFTWLDGVKWENYVERVYGLNRGMLPALVISDPKEDKYYDTDKTGRSIGFDKESLLAAIDEILEGVAKPKYTAGILGRTSRKLFKSLDGVATTARSNFWTLLFFSVLVGVAYVYGAIPGLKRGRNDPKAE